MRDVFSRGAIVLGWLAILLAAVVTLTGTAGLAQEAIRVDVNLATVTFTVRDANGALVDSLTKDDFEIVEDTVPQKITYFARSADSPLTLGLIVDASGSQERFAKKHQGDLEVFLKEVLAAKDRVFLVGFGNHIRLVNDFSHSSGELMESWKRYEKDTQKFPEIGPSESRDLGTAFYDSIYYPVTEKLGKEDGRKALLMFSDGEDNSSSHDMMTAIEIAQGANVVVYTIRYTEKKHGKLTARNQYGIRVMDRIAKETGGAAIDTEVTNPHTYFHQIAEELRSSYELAYYPTNATKDGSFRKIVIRAKRDGLKLRSKTGYFSR
jgi:Ca-activated chloride channel family protein